MANLKGKIAVVTGASKGIGAGIAERLAADGATVVVNYASSAEGAKAVVGRIEAAGGTAVAVGADVSKPDEIARLFGVVKDRFGHLDILVNNAGVYGFSDLAGITAESIDRHFSLNVKGLILSTQAAVPLFPADGGGVVVNISSVVGASPSSQAPVYSATKGAVDNLTRSFALELGPRDIRVVGVAPGLVATEGTSGFIDGMKSDAVAATPLGRVGMPSDIAAVVAFAVGSDGGWITGETLQVSGGFRP